MRPARFSLIVSVKRRRRGDRFAIGAIRTCRREQPPPLRQIAAVFVRYANFTLGGSATTAVLHREIVGGRGWVSDEQFALSFALVRLTPGTNLPAFRVGIGARRGDQRQ
jgi:Chromate transporter